MPWRLIIMIIVFAVFLVFITFNLDNRHNISFGFTELTDVPIFITIFVSFVMGLLFSIPLFFLILRRYRKKHHNPNTEANESPEPLQPEQTVTIEPDEKIKNDATEAKKRFFAKRLGGKK